MSEHEQPYRLDMNERNNHPKIFAAMRQSFVHYIPDSMTYNGYVDSRQVLVYFKNGEEISRFENGVHTYTPRFKELCHQLVEKMFEETASA